MTSLSCYFACTNSCQGKINNIMYRVLLQSIEHLNVIYLNFDMLQHKPDKILPL